MPYYYGYGFGIDPLYLLVVLVCTVLGLAAQSYINSTYKTWSKVRSDGDTGATVARRMLDANGCNAVGIKGVGCQPFERFGRKRNQRLPRGGPCRPASKRLCHDESTYRPRAGRQLYPEHLDHRVALGPVYEHCRAHIPRVDLLLV